MQICYLVCEGLLLNYVILKWWLLLADLVECRELLFHKVARTRCVHFKCVSQSSVTLSNVLQTSPGDKWVVFQELIYVDK